MSTTRKMQRAAERAHDDGKVHVVTSRGVDVICLPIVAQLEQITNSFKMPEPPTYEIESGVPGQTDKVTMIYDEATVKVLGDNMPEADRTKWSIYQVELAKAQRKRNEISTKVVASDGIIIPSMDDDGEWEAKARWQEQDVPTEPWARKYFYFLNYVIGTADDMTAITLGIYKASGFDKEVLAKVEDSFRHKMDESAGENTTDDQGNPET